MAAGRFYKTSGFFGKLWNGAKNLVHKVGDWVGGHSQQISQVAQGLGNAATAIGGAVGGKVGGAMQKVGAAMPGVVNQGMGYVNMANQVMPR